MRLLSARVFLLTASLSLVLCGAGCTRKDSSGGPSSGPAGPSTPAGARRVDVRVSLSGYTPDRITGAPGEQLVLVFHYQNSAGECGREVVVPSQGGIVRRTLSADKPVEVPLTLPKETGEVTFTCGMNMMHGALVVK